MVIFLSEVAVFFVEVLVGLFEIVDGGLNTFQLLLERVDLLVLLHGKFLEDADLLLALLVLLKVAVFVDGGEISIVEGNILFYFFGSERNELLEGLFYVFVFVSQR